MARNAQILILVLAVAFFGWSGYWWFGSSQRQDAMETWLEDRREAAWVADSAKVELRGFPNRFDTIISDIQLADPNSGWAWEAPRFELFALSYQPEHMIAVWPNEQYISTPHEKIKVTSDDIRASIVFEDSDTLELNRFTLTGSDIELQSDANWDAHASELVIAGRRSDSQNTYDLAFDAKGFKPGESILGLLKVNGTAFDDFEEFSAKTTIEFSGPLNRASVESGDIAIHKISVGKANATWGQLKLIATGAMAFDESGYADGKLTIRATNWNDMLAMANAMGFIDSSLQGALEQGLRFIALLAGNENELDIPLTFADRKTMLGPIPIGEAPRLGRN